MLNLLLLVIVCAFGFGFDWHNQPAGGRKSNSKNKEN